MITVWYATMRVLRLSNTDANRVFHFFMWHAAYVDDLTKRWISIKPALALGEEALSSSSVERLRRGTSFLTAFFQSALKLLALFVVVAVESDWSWPPPLDAPEVSALSADCCIFRRCQFNRILRFVILTCMQRYFVFFASFIAGASLAIEDQRLFS